MRLDIRMRNVSYSYFVCSTSLLLRCKMLLDEERQQRLKAYYSTRAKISNVLGCIVGGCIGAYISFVYFWPIPLPLSVKPVFPFQFVAACRLAFPFLNWEPVHDWFPWLVLFYYGICALIFAVCYVLSDWFNRALL